MCCYLQIAGCYLKLNDIDNCKKAINKAYEIVSLANGEDYKINLSCIWSSVTKHIRNTDLI